MLQPASANQKWQYTGLVIGIISEYLVSIKFSIRALSSFQAFTERSFAQMATNNNISYQTALLPNSSFIGYHNFSEAFYRGQPSQVSTECPE